MTFDSKLANYRIPDPVVFDNEELERFFRTNFYRDEKIDDYCKRMLIPDSKIVVDWAAVNYLRDQGFSNLIDQVNIEPRSVYDPGKLFNALLKFRPGRIQNVDTKNKHIEAGISLAYKAFSRPVDEDYLKRLDLVASTVKLITREVNASSGLTAFNKRKKDSMVHALERARRIQFQGATPKPCIAFTRTQKGGKTRLVWGYPYEMTIIEGTIARPLYNKLKSVDSAMAFGTTTLALGAKLASCRNSRKYCYSIDMSSYDASIAANLIDVAFRIIRTWFDPNDKLVDDALNIIKRYFITAPIVMPDHKAYYGRRHGVPSGSYFTQVVDSIVNVVIAGALSSKMNLRVSKEQIQVLGDDLIFFSDTKVSLESLALQATKLFGVEFNAAKSQFVICSSNVPIHYLGRDWVGTRPHLDLKEIIQKAIFPENYRVYSKDKRRREMQVKALMNSYAFVYSEALEILGLKRKEWFESVSNVERRLLDYSVETPMEHLSGLMRYWKREGFYNDSTYKTLFQMILT